MRLSTAYKNINGLKLHEGGVLPLELVVQVYNINHRRNSEILARSKILENYSIFIKKINEYKKEMPIEESVKAAVKYCIEHDILKHFLEKNASEIENMLLTEWNLDDALEVAREEAWDEGREQGFSQGREAIARNALMEGMAPEFVQKITGLDLETILSLNKL